MKISIVIPNYNGEELLKKNLPKVFDAVGDAEIIVVDDDSTDASMSVISRLRASFAEVTRKAEQDFGGQANLKFLKNEHNLGFSSTINRGVKEAEGDIVILLNTDVIPERGFLAPLLSHFKNDKVFAVGCMDESVEGNKKILRGRGVGIWKRGFLVHSRGEVDRTNTLWVSGGSGAFRKSIWDKLGGFSPLYDPFYWEDIDLSYRALKSGYEIVFEPKSVVRHEHEKGAIRSTYSDFKVKTIAYRNQFIFVWKNATDLDLQLLHLLWLPYYFLAAFMRLDLNFFVGFLLAFLRLPQVIRSNFRVQKDFVKSDSAVVKEFVR